MGDEASHVTDHTGLDVVLTIGATANVQTIVDDRMPTLEITWGSITVLVTPQVASSEAPLVPSDVLRGRDLARAAARYAEALEELWAAQEGSRLPTEYQPSSLGRLGRCDPATTGAGA